MHIWRGWCGSTVEDLRRNKHFPLYPDDRTVVADFFQRLREASFGERIFGFVHPPKTGTVLTTHGFTLSIVSVCFHENISGSQLV